MMSAADESPVAIALHGGAGTIERGAMSEELEATYRAGVLHGRCASYYQDGTIRAEGQMVDGKREDTWKTYKCGDPTPTTVVYEGGAVAPAAPPK